MGLSGVVPSIGTFLRRIQFTEAGAKTMVVVQIAEEAMLAGLGADFGLRRSPEPDFFGEWQGELEGLSELDRVAIARVVRYYEALVDQWNEPGML